MSLPAVRGCPACGEHLHLIRANLTNPDNVSATYRCAGPTTHTWTLHFRLGPLDAARLRGIEVRPHNGSVVFGYRDRIGNAPPARMPVAYLPCDRGDLIASIQSAQLAILRDRGYEPIELGLTSDQYLALQGPKNFDGLRVMVYP